MLISRPGKSTVFARYPRSLTTNCPRQSHLDEYIRSFSLHPAKPLPVVELVSVVVRGDDVQQEDVLGLGVQTGNSELHLRKHLPGPPINMYSSIRLSARFERVYLKLPCNYNERRALS